MQHVGKLVCDDNCAVTANFTQHQQCLLLSTQLPVLSARLFVWTGPPGCSRHGSKHATCAMWRKSVHQLHEPKHFHNVSEEATTGQVHSLNKELSKPPRPWKLWKRQKVVLSSWKTEPLDWDTLCGLHWECWRLRAWLTPCPIDMSYLHRCHIHLAGICLLHSSNTLQQGQQTKTMTALLPSRETECMGTLESLETKLQHIYIYIHAFRLSMAQQLFTYVPTTRIFCYTRPPTQQQQIAWQ